MTDWLLSLVPEYGAWLLAVCTFCSCVAVPIPASILMLAAGGFVAAGDLSLPASAGAALAGAVAGDQVGYFAGRMGGSGFMHAAEARAAPLAKATALLARRGGIAVFLSRWLVSALGPYVNLAAGAAHQPWPAFTFWAVAGEMVWVSLYVGLGYVFTGNLEAASSMAVELLGFLAAGTITLGLATWLILILRAEGGK
ncbi:VTT domain-containing protein [Rhizobium sp. RU36D]|uniref:DedA family protein n=1 Tax=Rhizobium sp. RU36D TaxID=1907415 RepID=UPI0009D85437|nr:VTT domain-containing protein [Rhizobium sp. RU36D]SMD01127.1 membrane protein DedA, SNARE-associated domain [Rhizobium sp. RU36D]